jgi:predicted nucleic acid-binding protein
MSGRAPVFPEKKEMPVNHRFFLDTNIFVYSFDMRNGSKRDRARGLIERALTEGTGFISYQVVQEFLNVALRRFEKPLSTREAELYLDQALIPLCEVFPSPDLYRNALRLQEESGIGFYDALIVASALEGKGGILYSEDFQDKRRFSSLVVQDPFRNE